MSPIDKKLFVTIFENGARCEIMLACDHGFKIESACLVYDHKKCENKLTFKLKQLDKRQVSAIREPL